MNIVDVVSFNDFSVESAVGFAAATKEIMPALRRYARRLTQNDTSSEDLVQETLVRAWAARARFQPGSNLKAWLFRIARNIFLSGVRRSWRSMQFDPVAHEPRLVAPASQEDTIYSQDLDRALKVLPAVQREALLLVVQEGLTFDEAAVAQHVRPGTLKSRVSRARSTLMRYFALETSKPATPCVGAASRPDEEEDARRRRRYELWKGSGIRTIG